MNKSLVITFTTTNNKTVKITIHEPKDDLARATIEPIAQKIIATKVFNDEKHELSAIKKIAYITREETVIE